MTAELFLLLFAASEAMYRVDPSTWNCGVASADLAGTGIVHAVVAPDAHAGDSACVSCALPWYPADGSDGRLGRLGSGACVSGALGSDPCGTRGVWTRGVVLSPTWPVENAVPIVAPRAASAAATERLLDLLVSPVSLDAGAGLSPRGGILPDTARDEAVADFSGNE